MLIENINGLKKMTYFKEDLAKIDFFNDQRDSFLVVTCLCVFFLDLLLNLTKELRLRCL